MAIPISPDSSVYLLKCPLEIDEQHQLSFATRTAQYNYFSSLPKLEFEKFSYVRSDGVLRVDEHVDNLLEYNYVMYQNENYSNKWFYCYITGMEYVNDNCTYISIKTDVYQTWFMDLTFKQCFVEREHVNDDTFGLHTLEENLPAGQWVSNASQDIGITNPKDCFIAVMLTELHSFMESAYTDLSRIYNGIPNGCYIFLVDISSTTGAGAGYNNLNRLIESYDYRGKGDAIVAMYLIPKSIMGTEGTDYTERSFEDPTYGFSFDGVLLQPSDASKLVSTTTITRNSTIDGYTPKNNKCFTRQFNYLLITNNAGTSENYGWEDFTGTPEFKLHASFQQGVPSKLIPSNYKKTDTSSGNAYGITSAPLPVVSWSSDYYLNWQASNGWTGMYQRAGDVYNHPKNGSSDAMEWMGEAVMNIGNYVGQTFNAITSTITGANAKAERTPNTVNGAPLNGDFTFAFGKSNFSVYKMSMKAEVARIVDKYFSAYGYKVSTWKTPNFTGRVNWNFVKLNQVNVVADIPQNDLEEIKSILMNGITIWHNPTTFLDYSQNNAIVQ